ALILYLLSNPLPIPYIGRPAIPLRRHTRCCQEQQAADQHQPQYSPIYYQLNGDIIVLLQGSLLPRHICDWFLELSRKPISWRNRISLLWLSPLQLPLSPPTSLPIGLWPVLHNPGHAILIVAHHHICRQNSLLNLRLKGIGDGRGQARTDGHSQEGGVERRALRQTK